MTINEFKKLSQKQQAIEIFNNGKHITIRHENGYIVNLYLVDDIFVEIWYKQERNQIDRIEIIEDSNTIDIYIDQYINSKR